MSSPCVNQGGFSSSLRYSVLHNRLLPPTYTTATTAAIIVIKVPFSNTDSKWLQSGVTPLVNTSWHCFFQRGWSPSNTVMTSNLCFHTALCGPRLPPLWAVGRSQEQKVLASFVDLVRSSPRCDDHQVTRSGSKCGGTGGLLGRRERGEERRAAPAPPPAPAPPGAPSTRG